MSKNDLNLVEILTDKINFAPYNPRTITESEKSKLKKSIQEFGYVEPIIVNKTTMNVVGGNQRLTVLKELGFKKIYVNLISVSLEKEKVLNMALNKISGAWDYAKLTSLFVDLKEKDIDVLLSGFDGLEIESLINSGSDFMDDIKEDDLEETEANEEIKKTYIFKICFTDKEKATAFAEKLGVQDYKFKGTISGESLCLN